MGKRKVDLFDFDVDCETELSRKERRERHKAHRLAINKIHSADDEVITKTKLPSKAFNRGGDAIRQNFRGRTALDLRGHVASTRVFAMAYPFMSQGSLGHEGCYLGKEEQSGSAFCVDPWQWYIDGIVDGTSMVLLGAVGTAKSTCAKCMVSRLVLSGRRAVVASDLKGEWPAVSRMVGGGVISVGPGRSTRINPLDEGNRPSEDEDGNAMSDEKWAARVRARRLGLLTTMARILIPDRALVPKEHSALSYALDSAVASKRPVTIPTVVHFLANPSDEVKKEIAEHGDDVMHALRRTMQGDLAGMFDGESTESFDADLPMMVIDTSALKGTSKEARLITNACTSTWVEAAVTTNDGGQRVVIYEEGWDQMSDPNSLARMVDQWKLARYYGLVNLLIMHKVADGSMAGDEGSQALAMAQSLISDADIRVVYRQKPDTLELTQRVIGLTDVETEKVRTMKKGSGLWKIGSKYSFVVEVDRTELDKEVFNTDKRMANEVEEKTHIDLIAEASTAR